MNSIIQNIQLNKYTEVSLSPNSDVLYRKIPYLLIQNKYIPVFIQVKDYKSLRNRIPIKCKIIKNLYEHLDELNENHVLIVPNYDMYNLEINAIVNDLVRNNSVNIIVNTNQKKLSEVTVTFSNKQSIYSLIQDIDSDIVIYINFIDSYRHLFDRLNSLKKYNIYYNNKLESNVAKKAYKDIYFLEDGMEYILKDKIYTVIDTMENNKVLIENPDTLIPKAILLYRSLLSKFSNTDLIVMISEKLYNVIPYVNYWCNDSLTSAFLKLRRISNLIPYFQQESNIIRKYNQYINKYDMEKFNTKILKLPIGIENQVLLQNQLPNSFDLYPTIVVIAFLTSSIENLSVNKEKHSAYLTNSDLKSYLVLWKGFIDNVGIFKVVDKKYRSEINNWCSNMGLNRSIFTNIVNMIIDFSQQIDAVPYFYNIDYSVKQIMQSVPSIFSKATNVNGYYHNMLVHYNIFSNLYDKMCKNIYILKVSNNYIVAAAMPVSKSTNQDSHNRALRFTLRDIEENILNTDEILNGNLSIMNSVNYVSSNFEIDDSELYIEKMYIN